LILAVVSLAGLAYAVLSSAVTAALPSFQHSLHASETGVTWLLTGFLMSAFRGDRDRSAGGRIAHRFGSKLAVIAGTTITAGAFCYATSPTATRTTCS
jgi:MFS family permease